MRKEFDSVSPLSYTLPRLHYQTATTRKCEVCGDTFYGVSALCDWCLKDTKLQKEIDSIRENYHRDSEYKIKILKKQTYIAAYVGLQFDVGEYVVALRENGCGNLSIPRYEGNLSISDGTIPLIACRKIQDGIDEKKSYIEV